MMSLRIFFALLLILALPLQGTAELSLRQAEHGMSQHVHQHDTAAHDQAPGTECGLCLFCPSAVILQQARLPGMPAAVCTLPVAQVPRFTGFIADTPERPPRSSFASLLC